MLKANFADGSNLPFGTEVTNSQGEFVGYVGQSSVLYIKSDQLPQSLNVKLNTGGKTECVIQQPEHTLNLNRNICHSRENSMNKLTLVFYYYQLVQWVNLFMPTANPKLRLLHLVCIMIYLLILMVLQRQSQKQIKLLSREHLLTCGYPGFILSNVIGIASPFKGRVAMIGFNGGKQLFRLP